MDVYYERRLYDYGGAQPSSASALAALARRFESCRPDSNCNRSWNIRIGSQKIRRKFRKIFNEIKKISQMKDEI